MVNSTIFLKQKGLTLIELMVVVTIIGIIGLVVVQFFIQGLKFFRANQARMEIQRDARFCVSYINRKLKEARRETIVIRDYLGTQTQPPSSYISFITGPPENEFYEFYQKGTKLYMTVGYMIPGSTPTTRAIAENLRHLTFCYPMLPEEDIISVSLCFEKYSKTLDVRALQLAVEKVRIMN